MPNPKPPKFVIQADKAAPPPGKVARRDPFLADEYEVTVSVDGSSAVVTHRRGNTEGRTLRVSTSPSDYQAVRVFEAASSDGGVIGQLKGGAVVVAGKVVTEVRQIGATF